MSGDFILAVASLLIARLRNDDVTLILSQVINYTDVTEPISRKYFPHTFEVKYAVNIKCTILF